MEFAISPLEGVGDLEFGMPRNEVRRLLGDFLSFERSPEASTPCDHFKDLGAFCYYDAEDLLEAMEFAPPARPMVAGMNLLGLGFDEACATLRAADSHVDEERDGAIARHLGVSVWAPLAKDNPAAPVESVLAFRPGYYG
jgi:hypothetical protein